MPWLIAEWTYKHYTGGPALMRYSRAGIVQLSVPFETLAGAYSTKQDTLTVIPSGQPPVVYKFKCEKDVLVLTDDEGRVRKFTRFEY